MIPRILGSFFALVVVLPCSAEEPDAQALYQKTLKASAWIVARGIRSKHEGTGFVVDRSRRWVVTNQHVVRDAKAVDVFFPKENAKGLVTERKAYGEGESILGRVLATDALHDLAVIELDRMPEEVRELKPAPRRPNLGEKVYQVGNPGARHLWETNAGTVARFTSQAPKVKDGKPRPTLGFWIRDDSPAGPGYSGGPVVNSKGLLVGVTAMGSAVSPQFLQGLPQLTGLLASVPTGPMSFLAYAPVKPTMTAWCIDLRELEDVLALVRKDPVKAQRSLHAFFSQEFIERGLHYLERGRPDVSLADFEKAVKADPNNARAYCCRAMAYRNLGNSSKALAEFEEAIARDSKDSSPFRERAQLYYQQKKFDRAIGDASEAIRRESKDGKAHITRGLAYARTGESVKAGEDFAQAVRLAPADSGAHNSLAWHLATCPEERLRDGPKGLEHASRACELTHWKNAGMLDTLAAAHAECGQFPEAIKWQTKALELANKRQTEEFRRRLQMYQTKRPYRQPKGNEAKS